MHDHHSSPLPDSGEKVILVGNPNVGKSVIFNYLTGMYVTVSNYPGTTVEVSSGNLIGEKDVLVLDTPGVNNLIPTSEDEVVTRNILMDNPDARVIQVGDSRNLERTLLLSLQLKEMRINFILCLNMADEARNRGIRINSQRLAELLSVPVISTIATQRVGLNKLIPAIEKQQYSHFTGINYPDAINKAAETITSLIRSEHPFKYSLALMLLASDQSLQDWVHHHINIGRIETLNELIRNTQIQSQSSVGNVITIARLKKARSLTDQVIIKEQPEKSSFYTVLGRWSHHKFGGLAIGIIVLFLMYEFVGVLGAGVLVDFLETTVFGSWLIPFITKVITFIFPVPFIQDLLIGEYGFLSMALSYSIAIVLPIVGTFFIAFGILEDSGYLPRLAVMMNQLFKLMGLNGKAVLPMVLGLGCDTMATMTTRILDSRKERLVVTLLLALGVPCSAQLGVILGMLAALSPAMTIVWAGCVIGVLFMVGYLSSKILPGQASDFVLELPPMRRPMFTNILVKTMARIEWYLREAVPLFFLGTFVLFILDKLKILRIIENAVAPVIQGFLGLPAKATEAFLVGFLRRDYGAAGLYNLFSDHFIDGTVDMEIQIQVVVSMITITLFMPCIANLFMIIKERGFKTALAISTFILPFSMIFAGIINHVLRWILL